MHHIKQELRCRIQQILQTAKRLPPDRGCHEIRIQLGEIQAYCQHIGKTFIFIEERITCDQRDLGGGCENSATLFRGPKEDASVAICMTDQGSLLYRNSSSWQIYRDGGDTHPVQPLFVELSAS